MTQHEATERAKELFGPRAFSYANYRMNEFIVGTFACHKTVFDSPLKGATWEDALAKFTGSSFPPQYQPAERK